jgi:hypothetical protein
MRASLVTAKLASPPTPPHPTHAGNQFRHAKLRSLRFHPTTVRKRGTGMPSDRQRHHGWHVDTQATQTTYDAKLRSPPSQPRTGRHVRDRNALAAGKFRHSQAPHPTKTAENIYLFHASVYSNWSPQIGHPMPAPLQACTLQPGTSLTNTPLQAFTLRPGATLRDTLTLV